MRWNENGTRAGLSSEVADLTQLEESGLTDLGSELLFEWQQLVEMIGRATDFPIAAVMFHSEGRLTPAAAIGLDQSEPLSAAVLELLNTGGYCRSVMRTDRPLEVGLSGQNNANVSYFGMPIHDRAGAVLGTLCLLGPAGISVGPELRELMQHVARMVERELELARLSRDLRTANERLRASFEEIKTLRGLVPICSECRDVRTGQGEWLPIEEVVDRSGARFTHGYCPDCEAGVLRQIDALVADGKEGV